MAHAADDGCEQVRPCAIVVLVSIFFVQVISEAAKLVTCLLIFKLSAIQFDVDWRVHFFAGFGSHF